MGTGRARRGRSLATRFFVGMGVMLLPLVNLAVVQWLTQRHLVRQFAAVSREADDEVIALLRLEGQLWSVPVRDALITREPDATRRWHRAAHEIDSAFAALLHGGLDEKEEIVRVTAAQGTWQEQRDHLDALLTRPDRTEDEAELEEFDAVRGQIIEQLELVAGMAQQERREGLERNEEVRQQALFALIAPFLLGFTFAGLAGRRLARHVLVPLRALEHAADRLAAGELSYRVDVRRRDELGALATAFNDMAADLERGRAQLTHQALHDPLTGLANRALLADRIEHALAGARRRGGTVAVLLFDLDSFKTVNDSLGHLTGDQVLVTAAERVAAGLPIGETAARLGGDEFAVLLEDVDPEHALAVAEQVNALLRIPFPLDGKEVVLGASVGVALSDGHSSPDELLRNADLAMYRAKQSGKGRCELYQAEMYEAVVERLRVEAELRRALERGEFTLLYQPTVELATGLIVGCEALVRWRHPERGMIPPLQFVPLAEEMGLIVPLGRWVLREACAQAERWRREHPALQAFVMSVNLSARQLQHPELVADVRDALDAARLEPGGLVLEITESVLMQDGELSQRRLEALKALGVALALDDFGTGYSSMSYLQRFPIDVLKVDKSFVDPLGTSEQDAVLAGAIIGLAHALNLATVAEGIEHARQVPVLCGMGCEYAQGYHFARPVPAGQLTRLLVAQSQVVSLRA